MEIIVFRHKSDIILILDKEGLDEEKHSKQVGQILQSKLESDYRKDWKEIDFHEGGTLYSKGFSYEWYGDEGIIRLEGETYTVQDVMKSAFSIV